MRIDGEDVDYLESVADDTRLANAVPSNRGNSEWFVENTKKRVGASAVSRRLAAAGLVEPKPRRTQRDTPSAKRLSAERAERKRVCAEIRARAMGSPS